ncbi:hypothetical protein F4813DRAFT_71519 [Daldinia decipiens]|uniref:uncharacterized protein n=1 Tax=Daldinia decipiens TaxID=326647 RepID=UPI0020C49320|nr:uncharacterized protein F4813DRAFT_71519 [Daldinia decipiens]KAI1657669.1 hypothetical protein F4813DRAFT_71519 [Daldinia decipiens]
MINVFLFLLYFLSPRSERFWGFGSGHNSDKYHIRGVQDFHNGYYHIFFFFFGQLLYHYNPRDILVRRGYQRTMLWWIDGYEVKCRRKKITSSRGISVRRRPAAPFSEERLNYEEIGTKENGSSLC